MSPPERVSSPTSTRCTRKSQKMSKFVEFDGLTLDLITSFIGERLPVFIYVNKRVFDQFLDYQIQVNSQVLLTLEEWKFEVEQEEEGLGLF